MKIWVFVLIDLLIMNITAFVAFAYDKKQAINHGWRVSEKTLLALCALGGSFGALAAMNIYHHKTKKPAFYIGIPVIIAAHTLLFSYIFDNYL